MKKSICVVLLLFVAIIGWFFIHYSQTMMGVAEVKKMNQDFEFYNKPQILGTDVTTVINKATDNNEKYHISKDPKGEYVSDGKYSIKIYVYMIINDTTYPMETLQKTGLEDFRKYFGEVEFECTNVKYHESTGRISEMTFAATKE